VSAAADLVFSTTSFVTTAQVQQWINDGLARIWYKIADSGEDYLTKSASAVPFVAGTSAYALPTDFYKAKGVDYVGGDNLKHSLKRYMAAERNRREGAPSVGWDYEYRLMSSTINFIPTPGAGSYILNYVPIYTALAPADLWPVVIPLGMEDFAVLYAAAQCAGKEQSDTSFWQAKASETWALIERWLEPRDQVEPLRVVDVHRRWDHNVWMQWRGFR
jgi:hypothetical protein